MMLSSKCKSPFFQGNPPLFSGEKPGRLSEGVTLKIHLLGGIAPALEAIKVANALILTTFLGLKDGYR